MLYVTSDSHFNHFNIVAYSGRPFALPNGKPDLDKMNKALIDGWNSVVNPTDTVLHLGDFAMGPKNLHAGFRDQLNGIIVLVRGNHDEKPEKWLSVHDKMVAALMLEHKGLKVYCTHVPPENGETRVQDAIVPAEADVVLCGHVHEKWKERVVGGRRVLNVGVDVRGYVPLTLEQLLG